MSNFVPNLYIGIGETGAMFTLRETYEHVSHYANNAHKEIRSFHHFNLGQDIDDVIAKALMISLKWGIMCKQPSKETLEAEMRSITRMKKDEREERARQIAAREAEYKRVCRQQYDARIAMIHSGVMPVGYYRGEVFADIKTSYLKWVVENVDTFDEENIMKAVAHHIINTPELFERVNFRFEPGFVGEEKGSIETPVRVIKATSFDRENFFTGGRETVYVTVMANDENKQIIVMSPKFKKSEGASFILKGRVSKHSVYNDADQTVVNYAKAL